MDFSAELKFHNCNAICSKCVVWFEEDALCEICYKPIKKSSIKACFVSNFVPDKLACPNSVFGRDKVGLRFYLCTPRELLQSTSKGFLAANHLFERI